MNGTKFDYDKPRMELLPFEALYEIAKVLTYGAKKYAPNDWKKVKNGKERYIGAMLRHLTEMQKGNKIDEESGLPHAAHLASNALFILYFEMKGKRKYVDSRKDTKNTANSPNDRRDIH